MRLERGVRRVRRVLKGPPVVRKEFERGSTCGCFLEYGEERIKFALSDVRTAALDRPDPLGCQDRDICYSLNKRKRWLVPDILEDKIEELQWPEARLRVSSAVYSEHSARPSRHLLGVVGIPEWAVPPRPTAVAFHDVSETGEVIQRRAKNQGARLRTLTHPARPPRREGKGKKRERLIDVYEDYVDPPAKEADALFQKIHFRYSVLLPTKPSHSLLNSSKQYPLHGRFGDDWTDVKGEPIPRFSPKPQISREDVRREYEEWRSEMVDLEEEVEDTPNEDPLSLPSFSAALSDFVVPRLPKRQRRPRRSSPKSLSSSSSTASTALLCDSIELVSLTSSPSPRSPAPSPSSSSHTSPFSPPTELTLLRGCLLLPLISSPYLERLPFHPPTFLLHHRDLKKVVGDEMLTKAFEMVERPEKREERIPTSYWRVPLRLTTKQRRRLRDIERVKEVPVCPPPLLLSCLVVREVAGESRFYKSACLSCSPNLHDFAFKNSDWTHISHEPVPESVLPGECLVCFADCSASTSFGLPCGHVFCSECWLHHVDSCQRLDKLPVPCMESGCSEELTAMASLVLFSPKASSAYRQELRERLFSKENLFSCPSCQKILQPTQERSLVCSCSTVVCGVCHEMEHAPLPCDVYSEYVRVADKSGVRVSLGRQLFSAASCGRHVSELTKCPWCSRLMQRSDGCPHMTCICGGEFCYYCGTKYDWRHDCDGQNFKRVQLVDAVEKDGIFSSSQLSLTLSIRGDLVDRQKELSKRLLLLPPAERIFCQKAVLEAVSLLERSMLHSMRCRGQLAGSARKGNKRSLSSSALPSSALPYSALPSSDLLVDRLRFALSLFLNTADGRGNQTLTHKARTLVEVCSIVRNSITRPQIRSLTFI